MVLLVVFFFYFFFVDKVTKSQSVSKHTVCVYAKVICGRMQKNNRSGLDKTVLLVHQLNVGCCVCVLGVTEEIFFCEKNHSRKKRESE